MKLGFTGTRKEPTQAQIDWLTEFLRQEKPTELHHGSCIGSDTRAHRLVTKYNFGIQNKPKPESEYCRLIVHPPTDLQYATSGLKLISAASGFPILILPPQPYLDRNRAIVEATDRLVAFSLAEDNLNTMRSGTWATVRYAKALNKPVNVIYPDGTVRKYN